MAEVLVQGSVVSFRNLFWRQHQLMQPWPCNTMDTAGAHLPLSAAHGDKPSAKSIWVGRAPAVTHTALGTTKGTVPMLGLHVHRQDWGDHTATDWTEAWWNNWFTWDKWESLWKTGTANCCLNLVRDNSCHSRNRLNKLSWKWSSLMHLLSFARDRFWVCPQCLCRQPPLYCYKLCQSLRNYSKYAPALDSDFSFT